MEKPVPRQTADDFHPETLRLFDRYVHGDLSRRAFLQRVARYTAAGIGAEAVLLALSPRFAEARQVAVDDARIETRSVELPSSKGYGTVRSYLACPANANGKLPTVLVVH